MITALLIALAAVSKAVADTLWHHYDTSVFMNMNYKFFDPRLSCMYVKFLPLTKYRPDAWHLANSIMIVSFIMSAVLHTSFTYWWLEVLIYGAGFNIVFSLFYDKILR